MNLWTIILFFCYSWGLGYSVTSFIPWVEWGIERQIMRVGIGLGSLPILLYILDIIKVPLDWRIVLFICMVIPVYHLIQKRTKIVVPQVKATKANLFFILVVILFLATFYMYHKGSFAYPWLEDGDPWDYAVAIKYVAVEKTLEPPKALLPTIKEELTKNKFRFISNYLPPYPPGFVAVMAILHQTSPEIQWTMKFFNALIISLGILFFYFLARKFTKSNTIALLSTFVLACIPSYVSHFIYSQGMAATLFLPALYCLEKTKETEKWWIVAGITISGILITQSSSAAVFALLFMPPYFIVRFFAKQSWKPVLYAGVLGLALSMLFWGIMIEKYTWVGASPTRGETSIFNARRGAASDFYTVDDFIWAKPPETGNMIDNPIGLGPAVFAMACIGLIFFVLDKEKHGWLLITVLWLVLNVLNVNAERLPIGFNPHRGWSFLAFTVALMCGYAIMGLAQILSKIKIDKVITISLIVIAIFMTSALHKYNVNTVLWPTHISGDPEVINGYMSLAQLPVDTRVIALCREWGYVPIIGMNMYSDAAWDKNQRDFQRTALNHTSSEIYDFLKSYNYEYATIDDTCIGIFGVNKTNDLAMQMANSGKMTVASSTRGFILFKVL